MNSLQNVSSAGQPESGGQPTIFIRFTSEGFHHWPTAPPSRAYLANSHRHLFYVEVQTHVSHDDREIEFHDLLDKAKSLFPAGDLGGRSCETLAGDLAGALSKQYRRPFRVAVSEDNEVGASVLRWDTGDLS
jgi:hypothetical protein